MKNILFRDGFFDDFVGNYCNDLDAKIKDTDKEIDKFNKSSVGNRALKGKQVETDLSKCRALLQNLKKTYLEVMMKRFRKLLIMDIR